MKKILTIGAYERDNFGDLLFWYVTKAFLSDYTLVPASICYTPINPLLEESVYPYPIMLKSYKWDYVMVIGGEIGGVDLYSALSMSLSSEKTKLLSSLPPILKEKFTLFYCDIPLASPAYLPDLGLYPLNIDTSLCLNSIGISQIASSCSGEMEHQWLQRLQKATTITVRDSASAEFLAHHNIPHKLAPDIVHLVRRLLDNEIQTKTTTNLSGKKYFLFQINRALLIHWTPQAIIDSLLTLISSLDMDVYLFAAGTAAGHDDLSLYRYIAQSINERLTSPRAYTIQERHPLALCKYIKYTSLWIGSSLHGRIIAAAYARARVSLENAKVSRYAMDWDTNYPHGATLDNLYEASICALKVSPEQADAIASHLESLSYMNPIILTEMK